MSGCGWRPTRGSPPSTPTPTSPRCCDELTDRYGPPPEPVLKPAGGGQAAGPGPPRRADRHHPAGQPHPVRAGGSARLPAGPGAAAVPEDAAQAGGAYDARAGAQGSAGGGRGPAGCPAGRPGAPAAARPGTARLVRELVEAVFGESSRPTEPRRTLEKGRRRAPHLDHSDRGAVAAAAVRLSACGPVRMGAAASWADERITSATLTAEVSNLNRRLPGRRGARSQLQFPQSQTPQEVLSWLVRFQVRDELAMRYGITVTPGESQRALGQRSRRRPGRAERTLRPSLAVANGLPPNHAAGAGPVRGHPDRGQPAGRRHAAHVADAALQALGRSSTSRVPGGQEPGIKVNPQFGRLDYSRSRWYRDPSTLGRRPAGPLRPRPAQPASAVGQAAVTGRPAASAG